MEGESGGRGGTCVAACAPSLTTRSEAASLTANDASRSCWRRRTRAVKSFFSAFSLTWWSSSAFCFAFVASTTACTCSSVRNGQWSMPAMCLLAASLARFSLAW